MKKILFLILAFTFNINNYGFVNPKGEEPKCPLHTGAWQFVPELSDEFGTGSLDTNKWYPSNPGWQGRPPGYFSAKNVTVKEGKLVLTSKTETLPDLPKEYHTFTTAAVKSKERMLYGYYEVRFKPMDSRASSAFWFYSIDPDTWTEIDVFEICGKHPDPMWETKYFATVHVMKMPGLAGEIHDSKEWTAPFRLADDFVIAGLEWNEKEIKWYVNGKVIRTRENTNWHQPLEMNFDSETMPDWFGLPDPGDKEGHFEIDYVRVWKQKSDSTQQAEYKYIFQNPALTTEERVTDLVSRMTLKEKADQLLYTAPAIPRLGVPAYNWWNEALHGVARAGYATVFPQSITIANSWDEGLMFNVANAISDEARAKYHEFQRRGKRGIYQGLTFWSPNINIFRDPRWGRGHETYGEDPFLTGKMGYEFVKGMQGDDPKYLKVVATAKHYAVHSGPEPLRHSFNAKVSESDLRETYLPAFRTLVMDAGVYSVMGAYNRFRDYPCCANPILYGILRNEWGFKGYIVSDCWAISDFYKFTGFAKDAAEAAAQAVKAGTDLECGVDYKNLVEAVSRGLLTETDINTAVKRIFTARFKLGMFDPDEMVSYAQIPFFVNCSDFNNSLSRDAARKSVVLLKNENNLLPLSKDIKTIAVIGPNADNFESLIGNYNGIPKDPVTVLEGIKSKVTPDTRIIYAEGSDLAEGIHNLSPIPSRYLQTSDGIQGAFGEYFNSTEMKGEPSFTRVDDNINFYWEHLSPRYDLPDDNFGIRWTTFLVPPETGTYSLGGWGSSAYDILLDGKTIISSRSDHSAFHIEVPAELQSGKKYKIEVLYKNYAGDADIKLLWSRPRPNITEQAVKAAQDADVVVLVLGLSQRLEGEEMPIKIDGFSGGDRTNLNLPLVQEQLFDAVYATGKPVIVVLANGGALSVNKAQEKAAAILLAGYGGQQGGNAVADVLFGDYNPAGRLPVTYYKSIDQIPAFENYDMTGKTYRFFTREPLYPFGYGLSYTTFAYSNLSIPEKAAAGENVTVSVTVTNSGKHSGDEVVELYLTDEKASTPRPVLQLEGFKRITLKPGESKDIQFVMQSRQFSIINKKDKRVIEPGYFTISVGGKQPGFKGYLDPKFTQVVTGRIRLTGKEVPFAN